MSWWIFLLINVEIFQENISRNFLHQRIHTAPGVHFLVPLVEETVNEVAAIAANIGLGYNMEIAVEKAIDFVQGAIIHSYPLGKGHGPINHLHRQRNLPFTPLPHVKFNLTCRGKFYDYLLKHPRIQPLWHDYTCITPFGEVKYRSFFLSPTISRNITNSFIQTLPRPILSFPHSFLSSHCLGCI